MRRQVSKWRVVSAGTAPVVGWAVTGRGGKERVRLLWVESNLCRWSWSHPNREGSWIVERKIDYNCRVSLVLDCLGVQVAKGTTHSIAPCFTVEVMVKM